jgi:hypothetical protein
MTPWKIIDLPSNRVKPGLLAMSQPEDITGGLFSEAKRVYWIINDTDTPTLRGNHYHPKGGKIEYLVALHGTIEVGLHSSEECGTVILDNPTKALIIPSGVWHSVTISVGGIMLAVASTKQAPGESLPEKTCGRHE